MGENEQGGMLRTVVVVGLVALIATVVIFAITSLKGHAERNRNIAINEVDKIMKPYTPNWGGDVQFGAYTPPTKPGDWNGIWYAAPILPNIPPHKWQEFRMKMHSVTDTTIQVDVNNYDLDNPEWLSGSRGNDNDDIKKRVIRLYNEDGSSAPFEAMGRMYAGKDYTLEVKYYNPTSRTLYSVDGTRAPNAFVIGTPDGKPGKLQVISFESATYGED